MNEKDVIYDFVQSVKHNDGVQAQEALAAVMAAKVGAALETLRVEVASNMFKPQQHKE